MSEDDAKKVNTVFFRYNDRLYCLLQAERECDFALVDVESNDILEHGHYCQLMKAMNHLDGELQEGDEL